MDSFADFVVYAMREKGFSNRILADRAQVSFRVIADARSGNLENMLKPGGCSERKRQGITESVCRLLIGLGQDPKGWMDKLGLKIPFSVREPAQETHKVFIDRVSGVLSEPLTAEDIDQFARVQKELGEIFSVEMALRLIIRKRKELNIDRPSD